MRKATVSWKTSKDNKKLSDYDEEDAEDVEDEEAVQKARAAANAALAKAEKKKGAVKTDSGLVYLQITPGHGKQPRRKDSVKVQFKAELIDGTVFDSGAAEWKIGSVIRGLSEGLQLMKPRGKARMTIPPDLAYGDTREGEVPAHSALIFEVELIAVVP